MLANQESSCNSKVAYFYHPQIGRFHYGKEHPMKPKRIAMAHNLIVNFGYSIVAMKALSELRCIRQPGSHSPGDAEVP